MKTQICCRPTLTKVLYIGALAIVACALFLIHTKQSYASAPTTSRKCFCHNICHDAEGGGSGTQCTSNSGLINGHSESVDCHTCLVANGASCSGTIPDACEDECKNKVEDVFGRCDFVGCGDGVFDPNNCSTNGQFCEQCDDGNNDCNDGCDSNCQLIKCDDHNTCTSDSCITSGNDSGACENTPVDDNTPCTDNDGCTVGDVCVSGVCQPGGPKDCDDGLNCTADSCNSPGGTCTNQHLSCFCDTDGNCDDGKICTTESCINHECVRVDNTLPCEDGEFCNGDDSCSGGTCSVHTGDPCLGGEECNNAACDEANNSCFNADTESCSDDGNLCTDDHCDGSGSCVHPNNISSCNDQQACTEGDVCAGGVCAGTAIVCPNSDGLACTVESCDPSDGQCKISDDECQCHDNSECNDGNPCTDDTCNPDLGCQFNPNTNNSCDDGTFCNGTESCNDQGACDHAGDPCANNGECNDACDEESDSCADPASTACAPDRNVCTTDICDGSGNCIHQNNNADCDDGDACTDDDQCDGGSCQGTPKVCNDGASCTDDTCVAGTCMYSPTASCECVQDSDCLDDGNVCTTETCVAFVCIQTFNGNPCNDSQLCNGNDQCDSQTGICSIHDGDPCAKGDACNNHCVEVSDTFSCLTPAGNSCPGPENLCTFNQCDGSGSCVTVANESPCNDENSCTDDACNPANGGSCSFVDNGSCTPPPNPPTDTGITVEPQPETTGDGLIPVGVILQGSGPGNRSAAGCFSIGGGEPTAPPIGFLMIPALIGLGLMMRLAQRRGRKVN